MKWIQLLDIFQVWNWKLHSNDPPCYSTSLHQNIDAQTQSQPTRAQWNEKKMSFIWNKKFFVFRVRKWKRDHRFNRTRLVIEITPVFVALKRFDSRCLKVCRRSPSVNLSSTTSMEIQYIAMPCIDKEEKYPKLRKINFVCGIFFTRIFSPSSFGLVGARVKFWYQCLLQLEFVVSSLNGFTNFLLIFRFLTLDSVELVFF